MPPIQPRGPLTTSNSSGICPSGSGPLGFVVHCECEIYGQTAWELAQALVAKHGNHTGWRRSEKIFFTSLPDAESYLSTGSSPSYNAYINAADDNGNLVDGVPDGDEIYAAPGRLAARGRGQRRQGGGPGGRRESNDVGCGRA